VLALSAENLTTQQRNVFGSYCRAFATRGLHIQRAASSGAGPYLFTDGSPLVDKTPHCYWNISTNSAVETAADGCAWIWHHGPRRPFPPGSPTLIVLPRNDLFEIRGIDNSPAGWAEYRSQIGVPWAEKLAEVYFLGAFTGRSDAANARVLACRLLHDSDLPSNVGLTTELIPQELDLDVPLKQHEPLHVMGQHRFVLSLWGNHPFNPRLYRGLEAAPSSSTRQRRTSSCSRTASSCPASTTWRSRPTSPTCSSRSSTTSHTPTKPARSPRPDTANGKSTSSSPPRTPCPT
jgi:hypothetical protein